MKKFLAALTLAAFTLTGVAVAQDKPKEEPKKEEKKQKPKKTKKPPQEETKK